VSAFVLEDDVVYDTYSAYSRGVDSLWGVYQWLAPAMLDRYLAALPAMSLIPFAPFFTADSGKGRRMKEELRSALRSFRSLQDGDEKAAASALSA
jgi:hypothetical protein